MGFNSPQFLPIAFVLMLLGVISLFAPRRGILRVVSFRVIVLALMFIALSAPFYLNQKELGQIPVLLDLSKSVDSGWSDTALDQIVNAFGDNLELRPFAGALSPFRISPGEVRSVRDNSTHLKRESTDLSAALDGIVGEDMDLLLISDGFETTGDVRGVYGRLLSRRVRIHPIVPKLEHKPRMRIESLDVPLIIPPGDPFSIRSAISVDSPQIEDGNVKISYGGQSLYSARLDPKIGGLKQIVEIPSVKVRDGIQEVKVELYRGSQLLDVRSAYVSSEVKEKILILSENREDTDLLEEMVQERGYKADLVFKGDATLGAVDLNKYSAVLLCNIGSSSIPRALQDRLPQYVKEGGAIAMIGGGNSFGVGGYIGTPIEPLLPVKLVPPETTKKRLSVGVALVMDKSGSMSESQKLDFAKEAAIEVVNNLKDEDFITVVGFDDAPFVVLEGAQVGKIRPVAREKIGRLFPAGRTNPLPAIDEGRRALTSLPIGRKHMIVLTDGRIPDASPFYLELMRELRGEGITVSTVLLSGDSDYGFLKSLAEQGGGGYYQTSDARSLPRIFVRDVGVSTGERTLKESLDFNVSRGSDDPRVVKFLSPPPLLGFVETKEVERADTELLIEGPQGKSPLLASWKVESGRALAFTSDLSGRWSKSWIRWPKMRSFWGDVVSYLTKSDEGAGELIQYDLKPVIRGSSVELELEVFGQVDPGEMTARLRDNSGVLRNLNFKRVSPGFYVGELSGVTSGVYFVTPLAQRGKFVESGISLDPELFGERSNMGINLSLLEELARETGGEINPNLQRFSSKKINSSSKKDLTIHVIILAGLFALLTIFLRERRGG